MDSSKSKDKAIPDIIEDASAQIVGSLNEWFIRNNPFTATILGFFLWIGFATQKEHKSRGTE